jgi:hypothetical protein
VILAAVSFVDTGFVNDEFTTFLSGIAVAFMFGMLKERNQALAGAALLVGTVAIIAHNQGDHPGDFLFPSIVFGVSWTVGFVLGQKLRRAPRRRSAPSASSASARKRHGSQSPRNGRGSRASSTTSSVTASVS